MVVDRRFAARGEGGDVFAVHDSTNSRSALDRSVLMLNAHYMALRVVSARRAFTLLYKRDPERRPVAEVVHVENGRYISYDFEDWAELSAFRREIGMNGTDWVQAVRYELAVPRIIRVLTFTKLPKRQVKFNRRNIFARDSQICQYCGKRFSSAELSLDHVIPRSRGGMTTWDNIVSACRNCNVRKGGRTPTEANLRLIRPPAKPRRNPVVFVKLADQRYASWRHFLDGAHWDVEHL